MKYLITADDLAKNLGEYIILDARSREDYEKSHVEGALHIPGDPLLKENDLLISEENFAALMGQLGISNGSKIVVYDDGNGRAPARFWFAAKHYGHGDIFVLDGGWPMARTLVQSTEEPVVAATTYKTNVTDGYIVTTQYILDNFNKIKILDVRTLDEYEGRNLVDNPRGGHIPGAANIPHADLLDAAPEHYFISSDKITTMMDSAGISKEDFIVPY